MSFVPKLWKISGETVEEDKAVRNALQNWVRSSLPLEEQNGEAYDRASSLLPGLVLSYMRGTPVDSTVEIWGLQKAGVYNEKIGIVKHIDKIKDRVHVEIVNPHKTVRVKGENLLLFSRGTNFKAPSPVNCKVVVIGAGCAGIAAANRLKKLGIDVVVLEGRDRIGGRIYTHTFGAAAAAAAKSSTSKEEKKQGGGGGGKGEEDLKNAEKDNDNDDDNDGDGEQDTGKKQKKKKKKRKKKKKKSSPENNTAEEAAQQSASKTTIKADLGANYMHKCWAKEGQPVFQLAHKLGIRVGLAAGGRFANTECARWFDHKTGKAIPTVTVARCHVRNTKHHARMSKLALTLKNADISVAQLLSSSEEYVHKRMHTTKFSPLEKAIHYKITSRQWGYVSELEDTGLALIAGDGKTGLEGYEDQDHIGSEHHVRQVAALMEKQIRENDNPKIHKCDPATGGGHDRLVVDGYHPFIIDHLLADCGGVRIDLNKSVQKLSINDPVASDIQLDDKRYWNASKQNLNRPKTLQVTCRDGSIYNCQYAICTVSLGVLKSRSKHSAISWEPKLSSMKRECIDSLGMGTHNKVVMRFREEDVFWPPSTPQLLSPDPRFHFLNLNAYGKTGLMLCHVWPPHADQWRAKSDEKVVGEAISVLRGMFAAEYRRKKCPKPIESVVTRWDTDPFSMGSYSYLKPGSSWNHLQILNLPHPQVGEARVFFAGEAASMKGWQCVDGAFESGVRAAMAVAQCYGMKEADDDKQPKEKKKKKKDGKK